MVENQELSSSCEQARIVQSLDLENEQVGSSSRDIDNQHADFESCYQKHSDSSKALTPDL